MNILIKNGIIVRSSNGYIDPETHFVVGHYRTKGGAGRVYIEDMYACNKEARNYYLSELMMCFNFVFNEMCHGTGSAANCDFDVEE